MDEKSLTFSGGRIKRRVVPRKLNRTREKEGDPTSLMRARPGLLYGVEWGSRFLRNT